MAGSGDKKVTRDGQCLHLGKDAADLALKSAYGKPWMADIVMSLAKLVAASG
jgi:hypothetical protein